MIVLIPVFGALSDHIGRKPIMIGALILYFALTYPLFSWMYANPSFGNLIVTQVVLCSVLGVFFGPMATALAEQFETHVRSTGLGMAYNMAVMIFGGFAPFFVTWLIQTTGVPVAPAFYVMFGAAVGLLAALFLKERARDADLATGQALPPFPTVIARQISRCSAKPKALSRRSLRRGRQARGRGSLRPKSSRSM
jgi:MFS transporter, MHS family, proline/betaine transporter